MSSFTTGIGKGLKEPVSPYRSAYIFGADYYTFNADNWNAIPTVWDPSTLYDLSGMEKGHEMVVALLGLYGTYAGTYNFTFEWWRDRDNTLLFRLNWSIDAGYNWWLYSYSYIGYCDWEVTENGGYHVNIIVSGPESFSRTLNFTVRGIPEEIPPVPVPGNFLDPIFSIVWDIADAVHSAYVEVLSWVWPFNLLQYPLYVMYQGFWNLLTPIANFGEWLDDVAAKVSNILSWTDILNLLRSWLTYAENAWSWVANAWSNVANIINTWWGDVSQTVQVWVSEAKQYAAALVQNVSTMLTSLQVAWDSFKGKIPAIDEVIAWWGNWWAKILTPLTAWWNERFKEVDKLINDTIKRWFPFYDDLVKLWGDIAKFFADPLQWVYDRLDSFFERFW